MPIPFILGGIAVAAGLVGAKKAKDASDKMPGRNESTAELTKSLRTQRKRSLLPGTRQAGPWKIWGRRRWISFMAVSPVSWIPSERFIMWSSPALPAWTNWRNLR